ncbi:LCP family protein [Bacillus sp. APMAM]|nr:LCP family protein [Bacillus sp. APMAM]RTZ55147.1 LytR family transcriptional regulator [Bacillus sp. SAJ1]
MNQRRNKKKKSRRWVRNLLLFIIFIIVAVAAYCIYQYNKGLSEATDGIYKNDGKTFKQFQGAEPQFGEANILLIGSDSRGEEHARSDSIMIAHYNQKTQQLKLVSLMRDMYVDIPEHGKQKLNAAFAFGGPELLRKTIKQTFDMDINYYAVVDFQGFSKIVDIIAPKGIEVNIPYEMSYGIGMKLQPGKQVLHGKKLLGYVRFRHDRLSDFGRVQRQQEVLGKLKDQAISIHSIVNLPRILGLADPYIDTNLDTGTILAIGKGLMIGKSQKTETLRLPVNNSFTNERVDVGDVLNIDTEKNKQALKEFLESH